MGFQHEVKSEETAKEFGIDKWNNYFYSIPRVSDGFFFDESICINDDKPSISKKISILIDSVSSNVSNEKADELSPREKDIVREIALGKTNKEIGSALFISTHTVITHRKNITRKLGIKSVSGLTVYAILNNIISIDEAVE